MVESTSDAYNGKSSDISYGDLIKCGINMGVSKRKCDAIISYIEDVAKRFQIIWKWQVSGRKPVRL